MKMKKIELQLETLSCPSCIKRIEKAMNKEKGVEDVKVLFNSSKVKANFDEGIVTADHLAKMIEKLGYPVKKTKVA